MLNKANTVFLLLLLAWFTVFITGLSIGDVIFAERDYDLITFIWWLLFLGCVFLYFVKQKIGQYVCIVFQFTWIAMQGLNFFGSPEGIARYNEIFEKTHSLIPPSDTFLVPDTAHLILFVLLLLSFIFMLIKIIVSRKKNPQTQ